MKKTPLKRKTGLRKKGKQKISVLKRKLWEQFSLFIRRRDNYTCFICGRKGDGGAMHAGHFIPKSIGGIALYFSEDNVHACCYHCNINLGGNLYEYGQKLGKEMCDKLYAIKNQNGNKWTEQDYLTKIEHYKKLNETINS